MMETFNLGIVGGGVIGWSIAYEMLTRARQDNRTLRLVLWDDGREGSASWAGSGILPPPPRQESTDPLEQLQRLSLEQMESWSSRLRQQTGIDNEYHQCGGYYLAISPGEHAALLGLRSFWQEIGTEFELETFDQFAQHEPWLAAQLPAERCRLIARIPGETQLRNPRHLQALRTACQQMGAVYCRESARLPALPDTNQAVTVVSEQRTMRCEQLVVAAGSWTTQWLNQSVPGADAHVSIFPIKGQILLFQAPKPVFGSIVNFGSRYFVPRQDGHILVGSTEEEVGFDATTTGEAKSELLTFVAETLPEVAQLPLVRQWAGFRPASFDQTPTIGRLPKLPQIIVASGHFRSGIQYSIGTARCVADLLTGQSPAMDTSVFRPGR